MQSINPNLSLTSGVMPYVHKFFSNVNPIIQDGLLHLGGGWMGVLFFAGLLLGLRSLAARRMRYFTMMSLVTLLIVQALGKTSLVQHFARIEFGKPAGVAHAAGGDFWNGLFPDAGGSDESAGGQRALWRHCPAGRAGLPASGRQ